MLLFFQDPALITNVTGYEPYDIMNQNDANIKWPDNYNIPANSSNEKGALLGYVSWCRYVYLWNFNSHIRSDDPEIGDPLTA